MLLGACAAHAEIDFDAPSPLESGAFTYSKEYLRPGGAPRGYFAVGDSVAEGELLARASIGEARWLVIEDPIWIRYDLNEHLVFRGTAPMLKSSLPTPGALIPYREIVSGLPAWNAETFVEDGFLLYEYPRPAEMRTLHDTPTVDLDLRGTLATTGEGDGVLRVRAFKEAADAVRGGDADDLDKSQVVLPVAHSLRVIPQPMRNRATAISGFLQFDVGARVPVAGFELTIDAKHRQPNGLPVGEELADLNVDVEASRLSFHGPGGFGFAPAEDGWTIEQVDGKTGLCHGDPDAAKGDPNADPPKDPDPNRAVHPVAFGTGDRDHPAGPATADVLLGEWYLCATVPEGNMDVLEEGDYLLTATLVPRRARPFPPQGVEEERVGTVWRDGATVHVPYLTTAAAYEQDLTIVNRHRRLVDYVLVVHPGPGGVAVPRVIPGKLDRFGPTRLSVSEVTTLRDTDTASGMLAVVSFPNMIDVSTTIANVTDGSTDTVVLHRGHHDFGDTPPPVGMDPTQTIVHVPRLHTADHLVQRLTINNLRGRAVDYTVTAHAAEGGRVRPADIGGTLPARAATTIRISDRFRLIDTALASATLTVEAPARFLDVAMTIVNRSDGSTDTVLLHQSKRDW